VEGVVIRISKPGKDLPEERVRFTLDPNQDWESYAERGPLGLPDRSTRASRAATAKADDAANPDADKSEDPDHSQVINLVLPRRAFIYTFARTPEGYDLFGVNTPSAPDPQGSRTGNTSRALLTPAPGPAPASFANIREGSFVAARYRKVGNVNEVLNLSLIELPTAMPATTVPGAPGTSGAGTP